MSPASAPPAKPQRPAKRVFSSAVLTMEAFVVFFASLVAYGLRLAEPVAIAAVGGGVAVVALLAAGLLRTPAGYALGWVVQVWLLVSGLLIPSMFVVGGIFVLLWVVGLRLGGRIDRERAERAAAEAARADSARNAPGPARRADPGREALGPADGYSAGP